MYADMVFTQLVMVVVVHVPDVALFDRSICWSLGVRKNFSLGRACAAGFVCCRNMSNEERYKYNVHTEFPTKDGRFVDIPLYPNLDIALICSLARTDGIGNRGHGQKKDIR